MKYGRLELRHREKGPLVHEATVARSDGRDQADLRMNVGQLDADRRRLEQQASIVELDNGDTTERVAIMCSAVLRSSRVMTVSS
jgi:hypothetical protein